MDTLIPADMTQIADLAQTVTVSAILLFAWLRAERRADAEREMNIRQAAEHSASLERIILSQNGSHNASTTPP